MQRRFYPSASLISLPETHDFMQDWNFGVQIPDPFPGGQAGAFGGQGVLWESVSRHLEQ